MFLRIVYNYIYTWSFESRVAKDFNSFYYLAIKKKKQEKAIQRPIKSFYLTPESKLVVPRRLEAF